MTHTHLFRVLICSIVVSVILPATAVGQSESDPLPDRVSLSVGGFLVDHINTELRVDARNFPIGTSINLTDDLEVDGSNKVIRLDGYYRFSPRHRIDLN